MRGRGLFLVRPARAHSRECQSPHELITASEVKRNCGRVTDRGKGAWTMTCRPMGRNWIEDDAEQDERA